MSGDFKFFIPLQKNVDGTLSGTASATTVDRDEERMSDESIYMMADDIKKTGVNLFGNHQHDWENILGGIDDAGVQTTSKGKELSIHIHPNKSNPKYDQLIGTMNTPGVRVGLSVGGNVLATRWEYDKRLNKKIKILDRVKIYEVSVVGIASNADSFLSIPAAIAKSAKLYKKCPACFSKMYGKACDTCLYRS